MSDNHGVPGDPDPGGTSEVERQVRVLFADPVDAAGRPRPEVGDLGPTAVADGRALRRRRHVTVLAAAAALVVVAVVAGIVAWQPAAAPTGGSGLPGDLPLGEPVRLPVVGDRAIRLPDGSTFELPVNGPGPLDVTRVDGGWIVAGAVGVGLLLVRDDGSSIDLLRDIPMGSGTAITPFVGRDRLVMQVDNDTETVVTVRETPSGDIVATTTLPAAQPGLRVAGVVGHAVLIEQRSRPGGDPMPTDVWLPEDGPYTGTPTRLRRWLVGASGPEGELLALEAAAPGSSDVCVVRLPAIPGATPSLRRCDLGITWNDTVAGTPDGRHLLVWDAEPGLPEDSPPLVVAVDEPGRSLPLPLPTGVDAGPVWWESPDVALFQPTAPPDAPAADVRTLPAELVRCRLDGSPCERAPVPDIDGDRATRLVVDVPG